jgi:hypothetical protein
MIFKEIDNMKDVWDICHYFLSLCSYLFTIRPNVPYIKIPLHTNSCIGGMDDTNGRARSGLQGSLGEKRSA